MPARNPVCSLTVTNAKAARYGLKRGVFCWVLGRILPLAGGSDGHSYGDSTVAC